MPLAASCLQFQLLELCTDYDVILSFHMSLCLVESYDLYVYNYVTAKANAAAYDGMLTFQVPFPMCSLFPKISS